MPPTSLPAGETGNPRMAKPYQNPLWLRVLNGALGTVITAQLAFLGAVAAVALAVVVGIVTVAMR